MPVTAESAEWITARSVGSGGSRCESVDHDRKRPSFNIDGDCDSQDVVEVRDPDRTPDGDDDDNEKDYYEEMADRLQANCSHLPSPYLGHRRGSSGAGSDDDRTSTSAGGGSKRGQRERE